MPSRVAIGDGFVWAAKNYDDSVVQIDPRTNQVVDTIPVEVKPFALAAHKGTLWVTSREQNSVVRVDISTREVAATIIDVNDPTAIAVTEDAVWVVNHRDDAVTRIDPLTSEIVATIPLGTAPSLRNPNCGSCISDLTIGAGAVWVSVAVGSVVRIDSETNQVVTTIRTKQGTFGIASDNEGIWFTNLEDQAILRIDPQMNQIVASISSSMPLGFLASSEGALWATTEFSDEQARNQVIRFDIQP